MTGHELRKIRFSLQVTQKTFAEMLGIHPVTVSHFESGEQAIPKAVELAAMYLTIEQQVK